MRRQLLACALAALSFGAVRSTAEAAPQDRGAQLWTAGDWAGAAAEWEIQAKAGDLDAMYNLGQAYRSGKGVPQSMSRAVEYYRAAAMGGHKLGAEQLGLIYYDEPKTRSAAVNLLQALANEGRPRSAFVIGLEYMAGEILPHDLDRARYFFGIASRGGVKLADAELVKLGPVPVSGAPLPLPPPPTSEPQPASTTTALGAQPPGSPASSSAWSAPVADQPALPPVTAVETSTASVTSPIAAAQWGIWFGPYRDNITAGIKFTRIAARAKMKGEARFVPVPGGVQVIYGAFAQGDAEALCHRLNKGRYQCRGAVTIGATTSQ